MKWSNQMNETEKNIFCKLERHYVLLSANSSTGGPLPILEKLLELPGSSHLALTGPDCIWIYLQSVTVVL